MNQGCFLISSNPYRLLGFVINIFFIKSLHELLKKVGKLNSPFAIL